MFRLTTIIYGISASLLSSLAGSKDGATYVNHVLIQLKQPKQGLEQTFVLTEEELNDFTRAAIQSKKRLGIEKLEFNLQTGGFHSTALINMEEVDLGAVAQIFKPLLRGTHRLELTGNFVSNECKGVYQVEDARFNDLPVPAWFANAVLSFLGKQQPPHIDVTEPFDLPYGIQDIRILKDKVIVTR